MANLPSAEPDDDAEGGRRIESRAAVERAASSPWRRQQTPAPQIEPALDPTGSFSSTTAEWAAWDQEVGGGCRDVEPTANITEADDDPITDVMDTPSLETGVDEGVVVFLQAVVDEKGVKAVLDTLERNTVDAGFVRAVVPDDLQTPVPRRGKESVKLLMEHGRARSRRLWPAPSRSSARRRSTPRRTRCAPPSTWRGPPARGWGGSTTRRASRTRPSNTSPRP